MSVLPLPYEQPLEDPECFREEAPEDWRDPSDALLVKFARENFKQFVQYIADYDKSLLFDFAVVDNKLKFRDFVEG